MDLKTLNYKMTLDVVHTTLFRELNIKSNYQFILDSFLFYLFLIRDIIRY